MVFICGYYLHMQNKNVYTANGGGGGSLPPLPPHTYYTKNRVFWQLVRRGRDGGKVEKWQVWPKVVCLRGCKWYAWGGG